VNKQKALPFVACPNHETNEGFNKLYPLGNGMLKCSLCKKEFTKDEVRREIEQNYGYKVKDLKIWYQQSLATLYKEKQEGVDKIDTAEHRVQLTFQESVIFI
jgi:hypothetical protein